MATRRPLVMIAGTVRELPAADVLPVPRSLIFTLANGTRSDIVLTQATALPFTLAGGASSAIPLLL